MPDTKDKGGGSEVREGFWSKASTRSIGGPGTLALLFFVFIGGGMLFQTVGDKRIEKERLKEEEQEAAFVSSLGLPDSLQGVAGLEMPNVAFKRDNNVASGYPGIVGGGSWRYDNRNPTYSIEVIGLEAKSSRGGKDVDNEAFLAADEKFTSALKQTRGGGGPLGTTFNYHGFSDLRHFSSNRGSGPRRPYGALMGRVHRFTYHERGGKGSFYMHTFHDGDRIWLISFKGPDDVAKNVSDVFMSRVKIL